MDGDDGVERVGLAGEHGLGFEGVGELDERGDLAGNVRLGVFAFSSELEVRFNIVRSASQFGVVGNEGFEALAFAHEGLRPGGVGPDGGVRDLLLDGG